MIHGHIYERSIDVDTITELCKSRVLELEESKRESGLRKVKKSLDIIKSIQDIFKYIG